jgi:hypothetical protein
MPKGVTMPETPIHDDHQIDALLRDAGARMRAATEVRPHTVPRPGRGPSTRRWIVPVTIAVATAAAVVAVVWIAGPASETVREAPADTGSVTVPASAPDVTAEPVEDSVAPDPDPPVVQVTAADFDGAGGACLSLASGTRTADACIGHRQLEDTPAWTIALGDGAVWQVTVDAFDPAVSTLREVPDVCGRGSSALIPNRWLHVACDDARFWFVAAPETPSGGSTTFVTPPESAVPAELVPLDSSLPDGFVAYRVDIEIADQPVTCLVVGLFPDPWREACVNWSERSVLVPIGGTVFLVDAAPNLESVEITDIATLSLPLVGCTAPVADIAAPIPETSVMISGLVCAGDSAMAIVLSVNLQSGPPNGAGYPLERGADGTWSTTGAGTTFPCDVDPLPACAALGADRDLMSVPLAVPAWGLVGAREGDLDPVDVTADVRAISAGASTADEVAASVVAGFGTPDPNEGRPPETQIDETRGLVVVDIQLLDDSVGSARYAVWYTIAEDSTLTVQRAYQISNCSRGIAAPDMCV